MRVNGQDQVRREAVPTFPSDSCDFRVDEVGGASDSDPIYGSPLSASASVANCPPNAVSNLSPEFELELGGAPISGDFVGDGDAFATNFLNLLRIEWAKQARTVTNLATEVEPVTATRTVTVPEGKIGNVEFVPRRAQIRGTWTVKGGTRGGGPFSPDPTPWETTFETVIDAPLIFPNGGPDGEVRPVLRDCTGSPEAAKRRAIGTRWPGALR